MLTPPRHRIDAPGIYVHHTDPALRLDLVELEAAVISEWLTTVPATTRDDLAKIYRHPWYRYASGEGRFDLDAKYPLRLEGGVIINKSARDYLDAGATLFRLRRLAREDRDAIGVLLGSDRADTMHRLGRPFDEVVAAAHVDALNRISGLRRAVMLGLDGVENWHAGPWPRGTVVDEARIDALDEVGGAALLQALALAILRYSDPLRRDEGLPSASPGTEPSR